MFSSFSSASISTRQNNQWDATEWEVRITGQNLFRGDDALGFHCSNRMEQRVRAQVRVDQRCDAAELAQTEPNARVFERILQQQRQDIATCVTFGGEEIRQLVAQIFNLDGEKQTERRRRSRVELSPRTC